MTDNKLFSSLLVAALLGIASSISNEFVFNLISQDGDTSNFQQYSLLQTVTLFMALPLMGLALWADRRKYHDFFLGFALVTVASLAFVLYTQEGLISSYAAMACFKVSILAFGTIALNKFLHAEKPTTQIIAYSVFWITQLWNSTLKFISYSSSEEISVFSSWKTSEKGTAVCVILLVCALAVWFLKRDPSVSSEPKQEFRILNGSILYLFLLTYFLGELATPNLYQLTRFDAADNAIVSFFKTNNTYIWLCGMLVGGLLCWQFDRLKVFIFSLVGSSLLALVALLLENNPIQPYLTIASIFISYLSTISCLLWTLQAFQYPILATIGLVIHFIFVITNVFAPFLSDDYRTVASSPQMKFINIFFIIIGVTTAFFFYQNKDKLYRLLTFDRNDIDDALLENPEPSTLLIPNLASGGRRFAAATIDLIAMSLLAFFFTLFIQHPIVNLIVLILQFVYYVGLESTGGTIGKKIMGITLVDRSDYPPSTGQAFGRMLARLIPLSGFTIMFGGEALHDNLSKTYVVYESQHFIEVNENEIAPQAPTEDNSFDDNSLLDSQLS